LKRLEITSKKDLYEAWHALKFICQEADLKEAVLIGQLAASSAKFSPAFAAEWKRRVFLLLRRPSTLARIESIMFKHFAHYRKKLGISKTEVAAPADSFSKAKFIDALRVMERRAATDNYLFAGRPVVYKPAR